MIEEAIAAVIVMAGIIGIPLVGLIALMWAMDRWL